MPDQEPQAVTPQAIGMIGLQPLADGSALAQINLTNMVAVTLVIPREIVKSFLKDYTKLLQDQQKTLQLVQRSKLH